MDKFNVIDRTSNIDDLEKDFEDWSNMPYAFRRHSDDDCIRKHGMTNQQYYDKKKAELLNGYSKSKYIGEGYNIENDNDYRQKVELSNQYANSPNITILIPLRANNEEELINNYDSYKYLSYKNRLMSDEYSRQIWGYSVTDIFNMELDRLTAKENQDFVSIEESAKLVASNECNRITSHLEHLVAIDDKIGLLQNRIHQYYENIPDDIREAYAKQDNLILDTVHQKFDRELFFDNMPNYVPYFTMDEMVDNTELSKLNYKEWKEQLLDAVHKADVKRMFDLGWNPGAEFSNKSIIYAKERQLNWLENNYPIIVNIQDLHKKFDMESGTRASSLYKERNAYPIFFIVSEWQAFQKEIKISLDSSLSEEYSFDFKSEKPTLSWSKSEEEFGGPLIPYKNQAAKVEVFCVFVDFDEYERIQRAVRYIKGDGDDNFSYRIRNTLLNIIYNKDRMYPYQEEMSLLCLMFIDTLIKLSNYDVLSDKKSYIMTKQLSYKTKVFKVYSGDPHKYKYQNIDKDIVVLFAKSNITEIKYNTNIPLNFNNIQNKAGVIESLNLMDDLLKPEKLIIEKFLPIRINDKGDITIEFKKDLEQQYQETHKLLTSYDKTNLIGIKHELAHLFHMNSQIENKIKKMKKGDPNYKTLIDLRARILNDFKTYIKIVNKEDPEFNFGQYFKDSEYYDGSVTVDNNLLKLSGNLIMRFLSRKI